MITFTCAHAHTLTLWLSLSFFLSVFLSLPLSHTIHAHFVRSNGNASFKRPPHPHPTGTLASLLTVGTFDADIKDMTELILLSPVSRWSRAPNEVHHGCSKRTFQLVVVVVVSQNKVEANFYRIVKITITEKLPCLSVCLSVCLAPHADRQTWGVNRCLGAVCAWRQNMPQQADCSDLTRSTLCGSPALSPRKP